MAIGAGGGGGAALLLLVLVCCVVYRMRSKREGGMEEGSMKYGGVNVEVSNTFNSLGRASSLDDDAPPPPGELPREHTRTRIDSTASIQSDRNATPTRRSTRASADERDGQVFFSPHGVPEKPLPMREGGLAVPGLISVFSRRLINRLRRQPTRHRASSEEGAQVSCSSFNLTSTSASSAYDGVELDSTRDSGRGHSSSCSSSGRLDESSETTTRNVFGGVQVGSRSYLDGSLEGEGKEDGGSLSQSDPGPKGGIPSAFV